MQQGRETIFVAIAAATSFVCASCAPKKMSWANVHHGESVTRVVDLPDEDTWAGKHYLSETREYTVALWENLIPSSAAMYMRDGELDSYSAVVCFESDQNTTKTISYDDLFILAGRRVIPAHSKRSAVAHLQRAANEGLSDARVRLHTAAYLMSGYTNTYDVYTNSGSLPIADQHVGTISVHGTDTDALRRNTAGIDDKIEALKSKAVGWISAVEDGYITTLHASPGVTNCGKVLFTERVPSRFDYFEVAVRVGDNIHWFSAYR